MPGEIPTPWMGHTSPGSAQGFLPAPLLSSSCHSRILPKSQVLQRAATSPGTQGHDGWLIAGGFSQILEVFVVVVMDSARQPPPPPLWLKACQDGSSTVEHKGSAWFLWRSHPDLPSDPTSSLILGFWGHRRDPNLPAAPAKRSWIQQGLQECFSTPEIPSPLTSCFSGVDGHTSRSDAKPFPPRQDLSWSSRTSRGKAGTGFDTSSAQEELLSAVFHNFCVLQPPQPPCLSHHP